MICENCGGEYRMKDVQCPFCQSENPVLAEIRREEALAQYDEDARRMQSDIPRKAMKKWTKLLLTFCGVLAGTALLTGIVLAIWAPVRARMNYRAYLRRQRELEELFAREDIEEICHILSRDGGAYNYPKFEEIWDVYSAYSSFQYHAETLERYKEEVYRENYDESRMWEETERSADRLIWYAGNALRLCRQYGHDRVIQGNEALFESYREEICTRLRELGISDQLLEWMGREQDDMQGDSRFRQAVDLITEAYMKQYYPKYTHER